MAGNPVPSEKRRRRLDQVHEEIERELGQGMTLSAADWQRRYPELEPELGIVLREMIGSEKTRAAGGPAVDAPGAGETIAGPRHPAGEDLAGDTLGMLTPLESATLGDPAVARMPSAHERTAALTSEGETMAGAAPMAVAAAGTKVHYIGDYETISVLGQGGMGVVYKARQLTLNRLVALKMIRNAEFASDDQFRRFQNEAEAVATLDHPGIVPIYEVGVHEDQRYFSMKLVEGQGLDRKLEELAKSPRAAARMVVEVADAISHAHQRGILHRDLKPANILVDGQGHPHVTDFGLAKRIREDVGLTVSGAIMGTPAYMAPEQAAGRSSLVTTSSDVYGLGAILYAALTGRAPFAGDSVMNTLDQVRNRPPQAPTRLNAGLPRDLEMICLKCLEKDPRHRYASAQALSDDLNRWLRGEPIAARPVGPVVRLQMWAKRKPALAGLSAALVIALIAGLMGVTWQWREAVSQRNQAQAARDEAIHQEQTARKAEAAAGTARDQAIASEKTAVAARGQAEQNAQIAGMQATLALNTIQDLVSQVQNGLQGPGLYDLKGALLASALKRIDGVAGIYEKSTSKEATTAAALMELGKIYRQLGQTQKAFQSYQKCLEITKERVKIKNSRDRRKYLVEREPRNVLLGRDLGLALYRLGNLADLEKHADEARRLFEATLKIREGLAKISEGNDRRQTELMLALAHVGQTARALELADRFSAGPNVDREQRIFLAACYAQVARATPAEKAEEVQTALVKAVGAVRTAVREGFRDRVYLETEPDLEPIRNRDDFKQIIGEIQPG